MRLLVLTLAMAPSICAQSEADLRRFFEGKKVRVKLDMPATQLGADVTWNSKPGLDFARYSQRLRQYGKSLHDGDEVMVTAVRVKPRNIEFHLGGGGYGTFWDDSGNVTATTVPKSRRETEIERELRNEKDPKRRESLNRELSRLRDQRMREQRYSDMQPSQERAQKQVVIGQRRREGGSRFNIRFPEGYLKDSVPSPEQVMTALSDYVEFDAMRSGSAPTSEPEPVAVVQRIRRGMTAEEVAAVLGTPARMRTRQEGALEVETRVWESADQVTEVDFTGGVAVAFRVTSR